MGYEYLVNEIWVDIEMILFFFIYFDKEQKVFILVFDVLFFEGNLQFKKVVIIYFFFIDCFEIYLDFIICWGEFYGCYVFDVNEDLVEEYEIDIKFILMDVVGDLIIISCVVVVNLFCDFNELCEGEVVIEFDCLYII